MLHRRIFTAGLAALALIPLAPSFGQTSDFPNKPIRLIVPFAAGGGSDILARLIGEQLGTALGQTVIVDNKPGGLTIIGTDAVAKAPADGYTLGLFSPPYIFNEYVSKSLPYNSQSAFVPVALIGTVPNVLTVYAGAEINTLPELLTRAKSRPGQLAYAYTALTSGHLSMELLKDMAGVDILGAPYKGGGQAVNDILGGQVQVMMNAPINMLPHIKSGRVKALATTGAKRSPALPDVPTVAESGFPSYNTYEWYGLLAPARTPPDVVARLNAEVVKILRQPQVRERLLALATEPAPMTPQEFGAFLDAERVKWAPIARKIELRPE